MGFKRSDVGERAVLEAYDQPVVLADEALAAEYPHAPAKVIYAAMKREYERGSVEYGVSLRAGWLTDRGRARLLHLREGAVDESW